MESGPDKEQKSDYWGTIEEDTMVTGGIRVKSENEAEDFNVPTEQMVGIPRGGKLRVRV